MNPLKNQVAQKMMTASASDTGGMTPMNNDAYFSPNVLGNRQTSVYKRFTTPLGNQYFVAHVNKTGDPNNPSVSSKNDIDSPQGYVELSYDSPHGANPDVEKDIINHYQSQSDASGKKGYVFNPTNLQLPMNNPTGNLKTGQGQSIQDYWSSALPTGDVAQSNGLKSWVAQKMAQAQKSVGNIAQGVKNTFEPPQAMAQTETATSPWKGGSFPGQIPSKFGGEFSLSKGWSYPQEMGNGQKITSYGQPMGIPSENDLGQFSPEQQAWLRANNAFYKNGVNYPK